MSEGTVAYQHILVEREGRIARVIMNRPQRRNALSLAHMQELLDCFTKIGEDREVAAVILSGNGPVFCAGHDLSEMTGQTQEFYQEIFGVCTPTDGADPGDSAAGHRADPRGGDGGRLPIGGYLRSGRGCRRCSLCNPWGQDRPLLLDADGGAQPGSSGQGGNGDAAHRRDDLGPASARSGLGEPHRSGG